MDYSSSSSPKNGSHKEKSGGGGGGARRGKVVKLSTDPQSIAARLRRRRISDRFKILQSLVPGGSRMDTVSMLEEAIQYVKFLKSQILLHQTAMINFANDDPTVYLQPNSIQVHLQSDRNQLPFCPENNYLGTQIETLQKVGAPNTCFQGDQIVPFEASYYY